MNHQLEDADGNKITVNDEISLLGPNPDLSGCASRQMRPSTTAHMSPGTVNPSGPDASMGYIDSFEYKLACGVLSQDQYDGLTAHKNKSMSEGQLKNVVDIAAVRKAFRHGYSR